jgi:hypothetical protein
MNRTITLIALTFFSLAAPAFGQTESATLSGNVLDASGGQVTNAAVNVESLETGAKRATKSGSSGVFSLTALPVGHYKVTIQAQGFESYILDNVQLQTGQHLTLDVRLQVGTAAASVDVQDTATRLDESTATVGGVVSGEQVRELPINGRSWAALMTQTPGAIDGGTDNQRSIRFIGRGLDDNNYRLDGVDATGGINQAEKGTFRLQFSTEAIAEFRADAALYTAESGGTQGGQVEVVSRSGTNQFHGSLFEYIRNNATDARGPFDVTLPPFRLNQFGGSFGGPVRKNKDFFFVTYEGLRQHVGQSLTGFVPSPSFRTLVTQTSPVLAPVISAYPTGGIPTSDPNVYKYISTATQLTNEDSALARFDHKFNEANTLTLRYDVDAGISNLPNGVLKDTTATTLAMHNALVALTTIFSPTTLNEFRVGFNRAAYEQANQSVYNIEILTPQFSTLFNDTGKLQYSNIYTYRDVLTKVRGKHTLKFGFDIRRVQLNATATLGNDYELTYASTPNFQNNILSQASLVNNLPTTGFRRTEYATFAQDEYRVTPTLTMNIGLRWEYFGVPYDVAGRGIVFDPLSCPGGYCPKGSSFWNPIYRNFGPRLGIAWAPAALHNKLVIRTGYGIFYGEGQIGDLTAPLDNLAGRALLTSSNTPGLSFPVNPALATSAFAPAAPRSLDRNRVTPYTEEWGLSLQAALTQKTVVTAGYIGDSAAHQFTRTYLNDLNPVTKQPAYPQFGLIDYKTTVSNAHFNALQLGLTRNLASNLEATANYMWSHAINDGSTGGGETDYPENVMCRACERGSSDLDIRQYFSGNVIYNLPFGKGQKYLQGGVTGAILGGWQWSNIVAARTGLPVNVTISRTAAAVPDGNTSSPQRPNATGISVVPSNQSIANWINPAAFAIPASGTFGNSGRNVVIGPGSWQIDTALVRSIPIRDRLHLNFRLEGFNILNHPQFAQPNANFSNLATFGQITAERNATGIGSGTPRVFEFAVRLEF